MDKQEMIMWIEREIEVCNRIIDEIKDGKSKELTFMIQNFACKIEHFKDLIALVNRAPTLTLDEIDTIISRYSSKFSDYSYVIIMEDFKQKLTEKGSK